MNDLRKNILIGNGVNIQFSGKEYLNETIITRGLSRIDNDKFPNNIYPKEIGEYFVYLFLLAIEIIKGKHDSLVVTSYERNMLPQFKMRYEKVLKSKNYTDIGFEDYFFVHTIYCRLNNIQNPDTYNFQESLKRLFIDSIFNENKINKIYTQYPNRFIDWLKSFDNVFTTNYDSNIEKAINDEVYHLHGAFHILSEIYDKSSLRNKLDLDDYDYVEGYDYLYSNVILDFSGFGKDFLGKRSVLANNGIGKYAQGYKDGNQETKDEIDSWQNGDSVLLQNLYKAIKHKIDHPEQNFKENYFFSEFERISGELSIIGLSPNNDNHILDMIKNNNDLARIIYYYYDESDAVEVESYLNKKIDLIPVKEFWERMKLISK